MIMPISASPAAFSISETTPEATSVFQLFILLVDPPDHDSVYQPKYATVSV